MRILVYSRVFFLEQITLPCRFILIKLFVNKYPPPSFLLFSQEIRQALLTVLFLEDMNLSEVSTVLLHAKQTQGLSFAQIGEKLGRDEVWVAALFYGQASVADENELKKLSAALQLNLTAEQIYQLTHPPFKGSILPSFPPTDPLLYRFHEILAQYGVPMKEVIHEKFGDGIMSAVDFTVKIEKDEKIPEAPRVNITMSGKFLPYKRW